MESKVAKLIILIKHLTEKMSGVCKDLDKIATILQDTEIVAIIGFDNLQTISKEDYE